MIRPAAKKRASLLLTMYLMIAVMGCFTFLAVENFHYDALGGIRPGTDVFFSTLKHTFDWMADDAVKIDNAAGASSWSLRGGLLRDLVYTLPNAGSMYREELPPGTIFARNVPAAGNTVLLKLRI